MLLTVQIERGFHLACRDTRLKQRNQQAWRVSLPSLRCSCLRKIASLRGNSSRHNQQRAHRQTRVCSATQTQSAFGELLETAGAQEVAVSMEPGQYGYGLYFTHQVSPGDVLVSVPLSSCLVVDYSSGLQVPAGSWPRLRKGVETDAALPWDILLALALLDGLSGMGDQFWERYAASVLPSPAALSLPLCLPQEDPSLLGELQHGSIQQGALAQKERLGGVFPGLSGRMCEGGPTWLEWGFGCVRSRAFRLSPDCFAFVPFLDVANHAAEPSCDFRLASGQGGGSGEAGGGPRVELVAVRGGGAGEEATISYTGPEGMTNQRLMAQYGFVPPHGNPADRLDFSLLSPPGADPSTGAVAAAAAPLPLALLSLDRLQRCLGDGQAMAAAFSGRDPYLYAALKSLPLAVDESDAASPQEQADLAHALLAELDAERGAWVTTPSQDQALLSQGGLLPADVEGGEGGKGAAAGRPVDARLAAVVQYRLQRKLLVGAASGLLRRFVEYGE